MGMMIPMSPIPRPDGTFTRHFAPAAFDQGGIAENAVARRHAAATFYAALEARGHVDGQMPEVGAPPAQAGGPVDG